MGGPLAELFLPLRFAVRDRFAGAAKLRDLSRLVAHHAPRALEAGADPGAVQALERAAAAFDAAPPEGREEAVRGVLAALGRIEPLPPELAAAAGVRSQGPERHRPGPAEVERVEPFVAPAPEGWRTGPERRGQGGPVAQPERTAAEGRSLPATRPAFEARSGAGPSGAERSPRRAAAKRSAAPGSAARTKGPPAAFPGPEAAEAESAVPSRILVPGYVRNRLARPLTAIGGVGPRTARTLARKGIADVGQLLFHLPRGYQDRRGLVPIRDLVPGQKGLTVGEVVEATEVYLPRQRRKMLRVLLRDSTSRLVLAFFHYWPSTLKRFERGKRFFAWGEVKLFGGFKQIVHPELEEVDEAEGGDASLNMGRIVPVYRGMDEVGQGRYRALVHRALAAHLREVPEILPPALRERRRLVHVQEALAAVHFPGSEADVAALSAGASPGHRRLAYEELLLVSLALALKARGIRVEPGHAFDTSPERIERALRILPFQPTGAQLRAIEAIAADMAAPEPMNRLIQGDVGSGKTAVALVACLLAVFDGKQAALMAPTEILAEQHHRNFTRLLAGSGIEVALLAAGRGAKALAEAREAIRTGRARIAVGTHALATEGSLFSDLGLVVIDEQHRFGVEQRAELIAKGRRPDVLVMTATPIPRTLALVLHGEMTQTVIDELPPGRTPVRTKVVAAKQREKVYEFLEGELEKGRQAYVVYPLIEESERSDLEDATRGLAALRERFPSRRLGLLHGRMKAEERDAVMAAFRNHEIDLLVSTTVVEVGVDVPNASVMVIEHAERFGLSQLHQLRGRVGRGAAKSYCFLIDHAGREGRARERLATMEKTNDGFRIAEVDLELRGPGEFLGTRQAGLPELQFADLSRDARLLEEARQDAFELVRTDPTLAAWPLLLHEVQERFADRMSIARVG